MPLGFDFKSVQRLFRLNLGLFIYGLALAMVIHSGRPLLLLDEPSAVLDRPGRRKVLDLLSQVPDPTALVVASQDTAFLHACGCQIHVLTAPGLHSPAAGRVGAENS